MPQQLQQLQQKHQRCKTSQRHPIGIKAEDEEDVEEEETKEEEEDADVVEQTEEGVMDPSALLQTPVFRMVMFLVICQDLPVWWRNWRRGF
jgi:CO dehydrogenase/acetyl-CoA synthase beta subunit